VDMATHRPLDLLEERTAEPVAAWLRDHPGITVICRDRASAYAEAAREGAPQAIQVADRWRLWHNLGEAVEKDIARHRADLAEPEPPEPATADRASQAAAAPTLPATRTRERYALIQDLKEQGLGRRRMARATGLSPGTVLRFKNAASIEELLVTGTKSSKLDRFKPILHERWNAGQRNASSLYRQIAAQGFTGQKTIVLQYLAQFRDTAARHVAAPLTPRRAAGWMMTRPGRLTPDNALALATVLARSPALDALARHVQAFAQMMVNLDGPLLDDWIAAARDDQLPFRPERDRTKM
jgi:hypothetical protein